MERRPHRTCMQHLGISFLPAKKGACPKPKVSPDAVINEALGLNGNEAAVINKADNGHNQDLKKQDKDNSGSVDQIHGEWMVVSRSKRKEKAKGNGKVQEDSNQGKQHNVTKAVVDDKKKSLYHKPVSDGVEFVFGKVQHDTKSGKEQRLHRSFQDGKKNHGSGSTKSAKEDAKSVLNSKADNSASGPAVNKKRLRLDPSPGLFVTTTTNNESNITLAKLDESSKVIANGTNSSKSLEVPKYGIQTTMDVEVLGANRLRFKYVEE
ncbi:hypothetical protein SESBI_20798 [Sesbania bispinosa]|nr:hypothetical protein SESBI_20798 [Sesbania bispinosa]